MKRDKMLRLEIIANHTVEDALMEELTKRNVGNRYTLIPTVDGAGTSGSRMGDGVWPEENFILIVYAEEEDAEKVVAGVKEIKSLYPTEGIKVFRSKAEEMI